MNICDKCKKEIQTYFPNNCVVCESNFCAKCTKQCNICKQYYCKQCQKFYNFKHNLCGVCGDNKKCTIL